MASAVVGSPLVNASSITINDAAMSTNLDDFKFTMRTMFYVVSPNETSFETIAEVPNYFLKALMYIPLMILVECIVLALKGRKQPSFGDALCSLCCALLIFLPVAIADQVELNIYIWCYDKFHIIDLPWNSPITWVLAFLGADLGLYCWHRAAHEINFIWAFHQVHHTSQEYNMSIGIRLPSFNRYVAILFYLPCALVVPPSAFYVHYQLNYIFQLWIHSSVFPRFGFLDYVINNPSLHKVHHGRNRYCIDKNYTAVLSLWDIIFGTFERERPGVEIHYGLVHSINSFNPIYIQIHHLKNIFKNALQYEGVTNKVATLLYGPGWRPGMPRLGDYSEIPETPEDKELFNIFLPLWVKLYLSIHYVAAFFLFFKIKVTRALLTQSLAWVHGGFILWTMFSFGLFLERSKRTVLCEGLRCAFYFVLEILLESVLTADPGVSWTMRVLFFLSLLICITNTNLFASPEDKKLKGH